MTKLDECIVKEETIELSIYKYENLVRSSEKLATIERLLIANRDAQTVPADVLNAVIGTNAYWQFTTKELKETKGQQL